MAINFPNTPSLNATYTSAGTTWIWTGTVWDVVGSSTVINLPAQNVFSRIAVAGQSNIEADTTTDQLTIIEGSNITITTDATQDSLTINSTGGGGGTSSNSFSTIADAGQSNVLADSSSDTLTLFAGTGIAITTDANTDTISISNTGSAGATTFTNLTDSAGLTVD